MSSKYMKGFRDGIPIGLGYLSVSFAFGITAVSLGVPPAIALMISMTNVTSAGQLAGLTIMTGGGSIAELILSQIIINLRYALMSVSLSQKLSKHVTLADRFAIAFCNTDEVFAVASGQKGEVGRSYMYGLITAPYIGWSAGTLLGTVASGILPASVMSALGIAIYGMFIAIIIPPAKASRTVAIVCATAAALSCAFYYLPILNKLSSGFAIILCAVAAAILGAILQPAKDEEEAEHE